MVKPNNRFELARERHLRGGNDEEDEYINIIIEEEATVVDSETTGER